MLYGIRLNVVMLSVIMMHGNSLNVVMMNGVAPILSRS
jgi:hypothetical protein